MAMMPEVIAGAGGPCSLLRQAFGGRAAPAAKSETLRGLDLRMGLRTTPGMGARIQESKLDSWRAVLRHGHDRSAAQNEISIGLVDDTEPVRRAHGPEPAEGVVPPGMGARIQESELDSWRAVLRHGHEDRSAAQNEISIGLVDDAEPVRRVENPEPAEGLTAPSLPRGSSLQVRISG